VVRKNKANDKKGKNQSLAESKKERLFFKSDSLLQESKIRRVNAYKEQA